MMGQLIVVCSLLLIFANAQVEDNFRHEYFGTYFLPYTRDTWDNTSCTMEEITVMLKLVSSKFNKVYTPSVGTFRKFGSWWDNHNQCITFTAYAAAMINHNSNSLQLQVAVGVDIGFTYVDKEMENALDIAKDANNHYRGTVSGITIRVWSSGTTRQTALAMIFKIYEFVKKAKRLRLEVGFDDNDCGTLDNSSRELLKLMDYIICWYAGHEILPPTMEAERVFSYFTHSAAVVSQFSNVTRVLGCSSRMSKIVDDPNATAVYWIELSRLATHNNFTVIFAFPITNPGLPLEYRRSGWWTQVKEEIQDESAFAEKRLLPPSQNKFITKGLGDLWKAEPIDIANISFDQTFGVVFRPVNTIADDGRNYTVGEIVTMLELVATRFSNIVTYRMGPMHANEDWSQGRVDGLCAYAASRVNKKYGKLKLRIIVGANMDIPGFELVELRKAVEVTDIANAEFPGTVVGIQLWSYKPVFNTNLAMDLLRSKFADKARERLVPLGIRMEHCDMLGINDQFLLGMLNMIMCNEDALQGGLPKLEARRVYSYFEEAREYISNISPEVKFIGMTRYLNGMPNQSGKLVEYWLEINKLVKDGNFPVMMADAFDLPSISPVAFRKSGWWKRITESAGDSSAYREKWGLLEEDDLTKETDLKANVFATASSSFETFVERHNISIVIAVVGGLLFIGGVFATTLAYIRVGNSQVAGNDGIKAFRLGGPENGSGVSGLQVPYDDKFEISENDIHIDRGALLGSGQYGWVYKGHIGRDRLIAAIKISKGSPSSVGFTSSLSEIKVMIHVGQHPNVLAFIGACTKHIEIGKVIIVTEFCGKGSLRGILEVFAQDLQRTVDGASLQGNPDMSLYVTWSHEIAKGMEYISLKNVIHADLATRNILVDSNNVAKVADFGLSKHIYQYKEYVKKGQEPLPWAWMAIESLRNLKFSTKSDVWSYGVTLWEIFSLGSVPYVGLNWSSEFVGLLQRGLRPSKPELCTDDMFTVMCSCWEIDPGLRPTFAEITRKVGDILEKVAGGSTSSNGRGYIPL